jgi:hypothetical protein
MKAWIGDRQRRMPAEEAAGIIGESYCKALILDGLWQMRVISCTRGFSAGAGFMRNRQ